MMPLLLQQLQLVLLILLSVNVRRVQGGRDFNVEYYTCDGDFLTIDNLELFCPSGSCGLGKDVVVTGTGKVVFESLIFGKQLSFVSCSWNNNALVCVCVCV